MLLQQQALVRLGDYGMNVLCWWF